MRYVSDDGKIFKSEQECHEYEEQVKRLKMEEAAKKKKVEVEHKKMLEEICQKRKELRKLTENYQNKFDVKIGEYISFGEFLKLLYGA